MRVPHASGRPLAATDIGHQTLIAFLISFLFFAIAAFAEGTVYAPFDYTDPVPYKLSPAPEGSVLRVAKPNIIPDYLCGKYRGRFDFTSGFTLHVFPDNTALIEEWCDISAPEVAAEGQWSINDNGQILFDWSKKSFESDRAETNFRERYGEFRSARLFLCFKSKTLDDVLLVSEEMIGPKIEHAYRRTTQYVDWEKVRNRLKKGKN